MKIVIADREYPQPSLGRLSVTQLMRLERETGLSRRQIREKFEQMQNLSEAEREEADDALILTGITLWVSRMAAGEDIGFEAACDVPIDEVRFILEPGDDEVAPDPRQAPPASGRGADGRPLPADRLKKKTSKKA